MYNGVVKLKCADSKVKDYSARVDVYVYICVHTHPYNCILIIILCNDYLVSLQLYVRTLLLRVNLIKHVRNKPGYLSFVIMRRRYQNYYGGNIKIKY